MLEKIKIVIPAILGLSFLGSIAWLIFSPDFEPAITSLALLASIGGIFVDRWVSVREQRSSLLKVLAHELYLNLNVVKELNSFKEPEHIDKPHIYPRFYLSSLSTVISSGLFISSPDEVLWKMMNSWLQMGINYNSRLDFSETIAFSDLKLANEFNKQISEGLFAKKATETLLKLSEYLLSNYVNESEIDYDTILFPDEEKIAKPE